MRLRKEYSAFRRADYENVHFFNITDNEFALGYLVKHEDQTFIVLFNADTKMNEEFILPKGEWEIIVNENEAGIETIDTIEDKVTLNPSTGMVLRLSK